ncbi:MAG: ribosome silencing factor [Paludibacteraceae bacterium]|jgi:ribosome-associated protein|nr:ribosome silencing factor [Paludibacteraceae bacterium]
MNSDKALLASIVNGMQEKKAQNIVTIDLTKIDAPCRYFVICEGNSKTQVSTIATSVKDMTKKELDEKPFATDGFENSEWIAMDYGTILVHIFIKELRDFYDIEHLWEDVGINRIANLD